MIYSFGIPNSAFPTGSASSKELLGGKGANLAEMSSLGVPVPPGFTFPCSYSVQYLQTKPSPEHLNPVKDSIHTSLLAGMDELTKFFGYYPLVSVRSGARVSMPGMMDTILNVGLCDANLDQWSKTLGKRVALDSYRRLIQMYSSVVLGVPLTAFEYLLAEAKMDAGVSFDHELSVAHLKKLVKKFLIASPNFPQDPVEQLQGAVFAVFDSWNTDRAKEYRKIYNISAEWGTAANIQSMVFGNAGEDSCTGVLFTRCPNTGSFGVVGEFLVNAQGEDVVAGIRTPEPLSKMEAWNSDLNNQLLTTVNSLEKHYKDMQDVEFTVQSGKLFILQTRSGKRTPMAAFEIASAMLQEGVLTKEEALSRVSNPMLLGMTVASIASDFKTQPHLVGVAAGGSVVSGIAVFTSDDAINCKQPCILIRKETDPDDIAGINAAVGILTSTGGLTSHAAVVARSMGKSCVVGATDLVVQNDSIATVKTSGDVLPNITPGTKVTIDGSSGKVWFGIKVPVVKGGLSSGTLHLLGKAAGTLRVPVEDTSTTALLTLLEEFPSEVGLELDAAPFNHETILNLGAAVLASGRSVVLNMTPPWVFLDKADNLQLFQFGGFDPNASWLEEMLQAMKHLPKELKGKITLRGAGLDLGKFKSAGFSVVGSASSVADLMTQEALEFPPDLMLKVFGSEAAYNYVVGCLKEDGYLSKPVATSGTYWFEVL